MVQNINFSVLIILPFLLRYVSAADSFKVDCSTLRLGQYICPHPDIEYMDPKTQQPIGCSPENKAKGKTYLYFWLLGETTKLFLFV